VPGLFDSNLFARSRGGRSSRFSPLHQECQESASSLRYDPSFFTFSAAQIERYGEARLNSFLYDTNMAIDIIKALHRMGSWGRYMLLKMEPSGVLVDGECSAGYAALCVLRYAMTAAPELFMRLEKEGAKERVPDPSVKRPYSYNKSRLASNRLARWNKQNEQHKEHGEKGEGMVDQKELSVRGVRAVRGYNWHPQQIAVLEELWSTSPEDVVQRETGHSKDGCRRMAYNLGLRKRDNILSPSIVAAELNIHPNTVLQWCRKGRIKAAYSAVAFCRTGPVWSIDREFYSAFKEVWFSLPQPARRVQSVLFRMKAA
jgi:hypothetical protein